MPLCFQPQQKRRRRYDLEPETPFLIRRDVEQIFIAGNQKLRLSCCRRRQQHIVIRVAADGVARAEIDVRDGFPLLQGFTESFDTPLCYAQTIKQLKVFRNDLIAGDQL